MLQISHTFAQRKFAILLTFDDMPCLGGVVGTIVQGDKWTQ